MPPARSAGGVRAALATAVGAARLVQKARLETDSAVSPGRQPLACPSLDPLDSEARASPPPLDRQPVVGPGLQPLGSGGYPGHRPRASCVDKGLAGGASKALFAACVNGCVSVSCARSGGGREPCRAHCEASDCSRPHVRASARSFTSCPASSRNFFGPLRILENGQDFFQLFFASLQLAWHRARIDLHRGGAHQRHELHLYDGLLHRQYGVTGTHVDRVANQARGAAVIRRRLYHLAHVPVLPVR